jgi:hypothetical protein
LSFGGLLRAGLNRFYPAAERGDVPELSDQAERRQRAEHREKDARSHDGDTDPEHRATTTLRKGVRAGQRNSGHAPGVARAAPRFAPCRPASSDFFCELFLTETMRARIDRFSPAPRDRIILEGDASPAERCSDFSS